MWHQKLFHHEFDIKIKKFQVINMVSIKTLVLFIQIYSLFLKTPNNLPNSYEKQSKQKVIKKEQTNKIHLKLYLTFLLQVFSSKIYQYFQKDRTKWQRSVINCQRLI